MLPLTESLSARHTTACRRRWVGLRHGVRLLAQLARVLLTGAVIYAFLVLSVRLSGKRTLAKLNAFDLVVTVALGSVLATVVISRDVA